MSAVRRCGALVAWICDRRAIERSPDELISFGMLRSLRRVGAL